MRIVLDHELSLIHKDLIKMSRLLETAIDQTIEALVNQDKELAQSIVDGDVVFNKMEKEIESSCIHLIATQQPVASDLRRIFAVVKIITDLERIADHCEDISNITLALGDQKYVKPLIDLPKMAKAVKEMVQLTVECYIEQDVDKAREVCLRDDEVDQFFYTIYDDLEALMSSECNNIRQCMEFFMIAKYFEKMADHATNIAEWVIYGIEGSHLND